MSAEPVFLSYVAEDEVPIVRLKNDLTRAGLAIVDRISAKLRKPGVLRAIESASHFVLCLSSRDGLPPAFNRDHLAAAIAAGRPIIPVRFTRCDVPGAAMTAEFDAVDLYDDWPSGIRQLVSVLPACPLVKKRGGRIRVRGKSIEGHHVFLEGSEIDLDLQEGIRANGTFKAETGE